MSLAKSKNNQAFSTATNLISHNNNNIIIIERDDTPPPPYSSVIGEIIHGGIVSATNACTGHVYTESHDGYCYPCRI